MTAPIQPADDPVARYLQKYGKTSQPHDPVERYLARYGKPNTDARTGVENFGRGVARGLSKTGTSTAKGVGWVAGLVSDDVGGRITNWANEQERLADEFYDPQGTVGKAGEIVGRVIGEGATTLAGGGLIGKAIQKLAPASKVARAITAGSKGNFAQRLTAQTAPFVPADFVLGAGAAEDGESRTGAGVTNVLLGAAGAGLIEGAASGYRAAKGALKGRGGDVAKSVEVPVVAREPKLLPERAGSYAGDAQLGPAIPMRGREIAAPPSTKRLGPKVPPQLIEAETNAQMDAIERALPMTRAQRRPLRKQIRADVKNRYGFADPAVLGQVAGAGGGALIGAAVDDENPGRGALIGFTLGAGSARMASKQIAKGLAREARASGLSDELAGAYERAASNIDFTGEIAKAADRSGTDRSLRGMISRFADQIGNGYLPIERIGERVDSKLRPSQNPRDLMSLFKSSDETVKQFLDNGVIDPVTRDVVGPSYKSLFEPFGQNDARIAQALTYIKAERDLGRGLSGVGGDAQALADAHTIVTHGRNDPVLQQFRQQWESYVDGIGNYAVKSGLWTPQLWERIKNSDALYVPFKRIMESGVSDVRRGAGRGLVNVTPGVKKFVGSRRAIANPAEAMAEYTALIIRRADRYRVGASLFDAAKELGPEGDLLLTRIDPSDIPASMRGSRAMQAIENAKSLGLNDDAASELAETFAIHHDPKNPVIWRNLPDGSREYAMVNSPSLWNALSMMHERDPGAVRQLLDVTIRPLKRVFTAATTGLNPRFALATNPIRDVVDASAKSQAGLTPKDIARGYYEGILDAFGKSDLADEAARFGMGHVSMFDQAIAPKAVARRIAPTFPRAKARSRIERTVSAPVRALEAAGSASDLGPRLGEYLATLRKYQHKVDAGEWTPADLRMRASTLGRGVTLDFANKPGNAVLRFFGDYVPFFNVALQAPVAMGRAAARNPRRVAGAASTVATATALAWALKQQLPEDERQALNDRPATERAAFLLVPTPGPLLRFPMGQEFAIIAAGVEAALNRLAGEDPYSANVLAQSLVRALPPGIGELAEGNLSVPIPGVQQLFENAKNRRDYGGAPVVPRRLEDLPASERRQPTTSPTFDAIAAGGRALGFEEFSPLQAENLVRGITSAATPFITSATDPIASRIMGRDAQPKIPFAPSEHPLNPASSIIARDVPGGTQSEREFYEIRDKVQQGASLLRQIKKTKDYAGVERLREYAPYLAPDVANVVDAVASAAKRIRDQEAMIQNAYGEGKINSHVAREALNKLRSQRQEIIRRGMSVIRTRVGM